MKHTAIFVLGLMLSFLLLPTTSSAQKKKTEALRYAADGETIDLSKLSNMSEAERKRLFSGHGVKKDLNPNNGGARVAMKQNGTVYKVKGDTFEKEKDNQAVPVSGTYSSVADDKDKKAQTTARAPWNRKARSQAKKGRAMRLDLSDKTNAQSSSDTGLKNIIEIHFDDTDDQIIVEDTKVITKRIRITKNGSKDVIINQENNGKNKYEMEGFDAIPVGFKNKFKSKEGVIVLERKPDGQLKLRFEKND